MQWWAYFLKMSYYLIAGKKNCNLFHFLAISFDWIKRIHFIKYICWQKQLFWISTDIFDVQKCFCIITTYKPEYFYYCISNRQKNLIAKNMRQLCYDRRLKDLLFSLKASFSFDMSWAYATESRRNRIN